MEVQSSCHTKNDLCPLGGHFVGLLAIVPGKTNTTSNRIGTLSLFPDKSIIDIKCIGLLE
jgi:hypothetical protein